MWTDPIVEELHRWRETHAARFQQDLHAIVEDLRQLEQDWPALENRFPADPARTAGRSAAHNGRMSHD